MSTEHKEHILPLKVYLGVAAALLVLTAITVGVSYIDLGPLNVLVAIGVATIKVSLVALFFMHLLYDKKINLFAFLIGVAFVAVFIILTMFDTMRRADIYEIQGGPIQKDAIIYEDNAAGQEPVDDPQH
jgi:cytochrome c oxidase subunit 4